MREILRIPAAIFCHSVNEFVAHNLPQHDGWQWLQGRLLILGRLKELSNCLEHNPQLINCIRLHLQVAAKLFCIRHN